MKLLTTLAGLGLALSSSLAMAAPQTITVFDGAAATPTADPIHPMVAVDSSNRSHVTWAHIIDEGGNDYYNIFYKLIAADGATLIDTTQISSTTDNDNSYKPQIAVNGTDDVFISWHTSSNANSLIGINPSLDDLSGDAATLATIQRFSEALITSVETGGASPKHPYIDVDSTGRAHILVLDGADARCAVYNADGTVAQAFAIVGLAEVRGGGASVMLDANDKMHIAMVTEASGRNEIDYSMFDCATGAALIDVTNVSVQDTISSMQPSLVYGAGTVYIIWIDSERAEQNCSTGNDPVQDVDEDCTEADNDVQFIALDPALDDQSGDAASLAAITKVAAKSIATPTTIESEWYPRMGMMETGDLQLLYYADNAPEQLFGTTIDANGDVVSAAAEIVNDNTTANPTSQPKASVNNRATVYPEAQMINMTLRDIIVEEEEVEEEVEEDKKSSGSKGILGLSMWFLLGFPVVSLMRRMRR